MLDPFNAFTALANAPAADGRRLAVKDVIAVEGMPQLGGIPARAGRIAPQDAPVVNAFRAAGHTVAGVTRTDAGGFGTMTDDVINPTHPTRATGGSSGGSAAAVAGGLVTLGLGTDTGGSVRIPAAYCGLYAFVASEDTVPMDGVLPLSPRLDRLGAMTSDAVTLAETVPILTGGRLGAPIQGPRIGYSTDILTTADDAIASSFRFLAEIIDARPIEVPFEYDTMSGASAKLICAGGLVTHRTNWSRDPAGFPPIAARSLHYAETLTSAEIEAAHETVDAAKAAWRTLFDEVDILISPTLPMPPADRGATEAMVRGHAWPITNANIRFCNFANAAGLPVVAAPVGGQSIQFVGRHGSDATLVPTALALARVLAT